MKQTMAFLVIVMIASIIISCKKDKDSNEIILDCRKHLLIPEMGRNTRLYSSGISVGWLRTLTTGK